MRSTLGTTLRHLRGFVRHEHHEKETVSSRCIGRLCYRCLLPAVFWSHNYSPSACYSSSLLFGRSLSMGSRTSSQGPNLVAARFTLALCYLSASIFPISSCVSLRIQIDAAQTR